MSTIKIYTGIGIFDFNDNLVAQGSQEVKFMGAVVVSRINDQTVVDIGGNAGGNYDGGKPDSNYGGIQNINGGAP
jgi:hypothetical protein